MRLGQVDPSSYSESEKITTTHIDFDWNVNFDREVIKAEVTYKFKLLDKCSSVLLLDVRDINLQEAFVIASGTEIPVNFNISDPVVNIGSKLSIDLPEGTCEELILKLIYETSPKASGLQWLLSEQTLGKEHPYLFSQCQPIHARSLFPCQDTPAVKFTYNATIKHPEALTALMSAIRNEENNVPGITKFEQKVPIPSYLLAIAVGKLSSRTLGSNCKVWAEEAIVDECAEEFSDTSKMLSTASEICGPYVWGQYDLLVMPPSFPFGGMENPCLTFVTPTLLAGDKSLVDVIAHEIAHSWTGNLVTNKNFEHFWLNEGFTVFLEGKIVGRLHGEKERDFHALRNLTELQATLDSQLANTPDLTKLIVDLTNLGPDDAFSSVPYIKGSTFLRHLEDTLGGSSVFEPFFRFYLNKFKYQSVVTDDFRTAVYDYFSQSSHSSKLNLIDWDKWLYSTGMPVVIPDFDKTLAQVCKELAESFATKTVEELKQDPKIREPISSHQLIDFLGQLIEKKEIVELDQKKINFLEEVFNINKTKNAEIRFRFLRLCIRTKLKDRMNEIIDFANSNFRMKFVRPIYRDLGKWPEARQITLDNFNRVKNQMMTVCSHEVEKDLDLK